MEAKCSAKKHFSRLRYYSLLPLGHLLPMITLKTWQQHLNEYASLANLRNFALFTSRPDFTELHERALRAKALDFCRRKTKPFKSELTSFCPTY